MLVTDDKEYAKKAAEETFSKIKAGEKDALDAWKKTQAVSLYDHSIIV